MRKVVAGSGGGDTLKRRNLFICDIFNPGGGLVAVADPVVADVSGGVVEHGEEKQWCPLGSHEASIVFVAQL